MDMVTGPTGVADVDRLLASMLYSEQMGHLVRDGGLGHLLVPHMWYERLCREMRVINMPYDAILDWRSIYHVMTCMPAYGYYSCINRDEDDGHIIHDAEYKWVTNNLKKRVRRLVRGLRRDRGDRTGQHTASMDGEDDDEDTVPNLWSPAALSVMGPLLRALLEDTIHRYVEPSQHIAMERLDLWQQIVLAVAKEGCVPFIEKIIDGSERMWNDMVTPTLLSWDGVLGGIEDTTVTWTIKVLMGLLHSPHSNVEDTVKLWNRWCKQLSRLYNMPGREGDEVLEWLSTVIDNYIEDMRSIPQHVLYALSKCSDGALRLGVAAHTLRNLSDMLDEEGRRLDINSFPVYHIVTSVMGLIPPEDVRVVTKAQGSHRIHAAWLHSVIDILLVSLGGPSALSPPVFTDDLDNELTASMVQTFFDTPTADAFITVISRSIEPLTREQEEDTQPLPFTWDCYKAFCSGMEGMGDGEAWDGVGRRVHEWIGSDGEPCHAECPITTHRLREWIKKIYVERWTEYTVIDWTYSITDGLHKDNDALLYCRGLILYYGKIFLDAQEGDSKVLERIEVVFTQVCNAIVGYLGEELGVSVWVMILNAVATLDIKALELAMSVARNELSVNDYANVLYMTVCEMIPRQWEGNGPLIGRECIERLLDHLDSLSNERKLSIEEMRDLSTLLKRALKLADWDTLEYTLLLCLPYAGYDHARLVILRVTKEASFIFYDAPPRVAELLWQVLLAPSSTGKERMEEMRPYQWGSEMVGR